MPAVPFWSAAPDIASAFYGIFAAPQARKLGLEQLGIGIWFLERAWPGVYRLLMQSRFRRALLSIAAPSCGSYLRSRTRYG